MKQYIFIIGWLIIGGFLISLSFHYRSASDVVVAEVTPQKIAVSFKKAVKIKEINVLPGQDIDSGSLLLIAERPDLNLDITSSLNRIDQLNLELAKLQEQRILKRKIDNLEFKTKIESINRKIEDINNTSQVNNDILNSFESIKIDTALSPKNKSSNFQIQSLTYEYNILETSHRESVRLNDQQFLADSFNIVLDKQKVQMELDQYNAEKEELTSYAADKGTIGSVSVEEGELVPPYKTVMTIYGQNPSIIKAFINEANKMQLEVGNKVTVSSSNRDYKIEGEVIDIGSRITDYPSRLIPNELVSSWGQEIFISIPTVNNFLNGEKVYVRKK